MKKALVVCILLILISLCGCTASEMLTLSTVSGEIGSFELTSPSDGEIVTKLPTFRWTEAKNAETYTFEICSTRDFSQQDEDGNANVYVKKAGITTTSYTLSANLTKKECDYYWRVVAQNSQAKKQCESSFYYDSVKGEVEFAIEYADDWSVHELGSHADLSVDNSNFFGNDKSALVTAFVAEDTKQGNVESDGWIVVTNTAETEMFGVDAFYFNFYYNGDDSEIWFRCVDEDNEYWNAQIKLAKNAKQTIIIPFEDFTLRTKGGTIIANEKFDYNHIKSVELVFEKTFGDGVAMISNIKAINRADYAEMFVEQVDFNSFDEQTTIHDNYNFALAPSDDGSAIDISFSGSANEQNEKGMQGYAFVKFVIEKLTVTGDAFSLNLKYAGTNSNATVLIRILEEDGDRWVYRQPVKTIPQDGNIVIPFVAFTLSQYTGDGARQFNYLKQLQIGIENNYSSGTITVGNFRVATLEKEVDNLYVGSVAENGVIDDFESYGSSAELYYVWQASSDNKDEAMTLSKQYAVLNNNQYATLCYKSDMYPACYAVQFDTELANFSSISFIAKDMSTKAEGPFEHLDSVNAKLVVSLLVLRDATLETYSYEIAQLNSDWYCYDIAFADFTDGGKPVSEFTSEYVKGVVFELSYYYYTADGAPYPVYMPSNQVLLDNVQFKNSQKTTEEILITKLLPSAEDEKVCVVDNFDNYTQETISWQNIGLQDYSELSLSSDTVSGNGQSMQMSYQGSNSVNYRLHVEFDASVNARAIKLMLKGDNQAKVYVNIIVSYAGSTYKFRATIENVTDEWTEYTIGFNRFVKVEGAGSQTLSSKLVVNITDISIGIVNSTGEKSSVLIDEIRLDGNAKYTDYSETVLGEEND